MKRILSLFRKGQKTDVRALDVWFRGPLIVLRNACPWITPNHITFARILLLGFTMSMLMDDPATFAAFVVVLRIAEGYTDVSDGVWARLFNHRARYLLWWRRLDTLLCRALGPPAQFGKFFDQASDKISHWVFVGYLIWGMGLQPIIDWKLGHVPCFKTILGLGLALDCTNFLLRVRDYGRPEMENNRLSSGLGKAKTWCYSFGGVFLLLPYAWEAAGTDQLMLLWTAFCGLLSWGLTAGLLPMEKTGNGWRQPPWRTAAIAGLAAIVVANHWSPGRTFVHIFGQITLTAGVILGIASTWQQVFPSSGPTTRPTRLFVEQPNSDKPTKE